MRKTKMSPVILIRFAAVAMFSLTVYSSSAVARAPLFDEQRGVLTIAPLLEKATPAVVSISVASRRPGDDSLLMRDPFFRRYFGVPESDLERQVVSAGSGVIVDASRGHVLTNHHVINNAERITVTVKDGRQFSGKLVGSDAATDIALLAIEPANLAELPLGDSDSLRVGDVVLAIGNPFGLGQTVTSGIVSALGRAGLSAEKYEDFIQTDAPINPGNSGGALINTKGELMGINTAIIAPSGGNVGIGFAVPSNMVRAVTEQLLKHGEVRRGRLGVSVQPVTPDIAATLGVPGKRGALVGMVEKGSPAEQAGLRAGDVIVAMDGQPVLDANDVRNRIGLKERGSTVQMTVARMSETRTITVHVGGLRAATIGRGNIASRLTRVHRPDTLEGRSVTRGLHSRLVEGDRRRRSASRAASHQTRVCMLRYDPARRRAMHDETNIPSARLNAPDLKSDLDAMLDEALKLTFPASDPIALGLDEVGPRVGRPTSPPAQESRQVAGPALGVDQKEFKRDEARAS
jgi:Do/DeqQ family serine protease